MWLKTLYYFGLLILPSIIFGQKWTPIFSNGMEKEIMPNSLLKECHSGPIIWSNCREKGNMFSGQPNQVNTELTKLDWSGNVYQTEPDITEPKITNRTKPNWIPNQSSKSSPVRSSTEYVSISK